MKCWYKKWWIWVLAIIAVVFLIPCIINELYKLNKGYITLWEAKDVLSFYGSMLSFLGSVVLGTIAVWQNKKTNDINDRLLALQAITLNRQNASDIIIEKLDAINGDVVNLSNEIEAYDTNSHVRLLLKNCGGTVLNEIRFVFKNELTFKSHIILSVGEEKSIKVAVPIGSESDDLVKVIFTSCSGIDTFGDFRLGKRSTYFIERYYHYYGLDKEETQND